jgi:hypothetical protein
MCETAQTPSRDQALLVPMRKSPVQDETQLSPPRLGAGFVRQFKELGYGIQTQYCSQGAIAVLSWAVKKIIFSKWSATVFAEDGSLERRPSLWPAGYIYSLPITVSRMSLVDRQALIAFGKGTLLHDLLPQDELFWVKFNQKIVSAGAIMFSSPQLSVLGLPNDGILIGHCETSPSYRGLGLYRCAINDTLLFLRARSDRNIFMETRPDNQSSQSGIMRAGLVLDRVVNAKIFFRSIVVRADGLQWIKRG